METWELDSIAAELEKLMPDTCDIYRRSGADEYGGGADFGAPHAEGVVVSVEPVVSRPFTGHANAAGRELGELVEFELAFPRGTDVADGDMVEVTSLGDAQILVRMVEVPESWDTMVKAQGTLVQ